MHKKLWWLVVILLLWPLNHGAATEASKSPEEKVEENKKVPGLFQLQEIEVTAKELQLNIETPNLTIIKPEILLQGMGSTLDGALKRQPGVDVQRLQEVGGALNDDSIKIRGFGARRILVTIDGRPLNTPGTAGGYFIDWTTIPLNNIERIELIKGVSDPRYGNTLGGVINLVTKKPTISPKFEIQAGLAKFDTFTANFFHGWKPGKGIFEYSVSGGYSTSAGYLWNGHFRIKNLNTYTGLNLPWEGKLFANVQLLEIKKGFLVNNRLSKDYDSPLYDTPRNPDYPASDGDIMYGGMGAYPEPGSFWIKERLIFDVNYEQKVRDQGLFRARFWKNYGRREAYNTRVALGRIFHKRFFDDDSFGVDASYRHIWKNHTFTMGMDYIRFADRGDKLFPDDFRYPNPAVAKQHGNYVNSEILGLYLMDEIKFKEKFILTPGLRYAWMAAHPGPAGRAAPDLITQDLTQCGLSPSLKFTYLLGEDSLAYLSVARALRLATPPEYFWHYTQDNDPYSTLFRGTPLKKEDGILIQGGVKYNWGGKTSLEISPYCYIVNDFIHFDLINFVAYNIDRAVLYGVEMQVSQKLPHGFTVFANYTFQKSKVSGDPFVAQFVAPPDRGFNQLPGLPAHKVNAGIQYKGKFKEKLAFYMTFVSDQQVIYNNNTLGNTNLRVRTQPAYVTFDLEGSVPIPIKGKDHVELYAFLHNLTDARYQERFGYPAAPFTVGGGLKLKY
ncbi:MAG: TonB-dependent receptor [Desulfobaccales bacterium]